MATRPRASNGDALILDDSERRFCEQLSGAAAQPPKRCGGEIRRRDLSPRSTASETRRDLRPRNSPQTLEEEHKAMLKTWQNPNAKDSRRHFSQPLSTTLRGRTFARRSRASRSGFDALRLGHRQAEGHG